MGLKRNTIDPNIYYRQSQTLILILIPYVDDIYLTSSDTLGVAHLKRQLTGNYDMIDLGLLQKFLKV